MLTNNECTHLRDLLFAMTFPKERMFRFLAVVPGGDDEVEATVHFAYAPPVWDRAGRPSGTNNVATVLQEAIGATPYKGRRFALQFHEYMHGGWTLPWNITAKDSHDNFPTLVLLESDGGRVTGALMRNPHCYSVTPRLAGAYAEPHEVEALIEILARLDTDDLFMGWYKDYNITAESLDAAIAMAPETDAGQKAVLLYRSSEWLFGHWHNPTKSNPLTMELTSVADFHGTRVSASKRKARSNIEPARDMKTLAGDWSVLDNVLGVLAESATDYEQHPEGFEAHPAVAALCNWWNTYAPESARSARHFRLYVWDADNSTFMPGDPEEPAVQADALAHIPTYALFEKHGRPTVAVAFYRGRAFNTDLDGATQTYYANGEEAWDIGQPLDEVDEARYALRGLASLADELCGV